MVKTCRRCLIKFDINQFRLRSSGYYVSYCYDCCKKNSTEWNIKNKERKANNMDKWYNKNPEKLSSKWRALNFNIEKYNKLLIEQNNLCAICHKEETLKGVSGKIKRFAVDHCHKTGKIRGLLCGKCNKSIGLFEDNIEKLQKAISYLCK